MRIKDWECVVSPDGNARGASHPDNGVVSYIHGVGLNAHAAIPPEVLDWLLRPRLRTCWDAGALYGTTVQNPYNGEPPNKDKEPS